MFKVDLHRTNLAEGKLEEVINDLITEFNFYLAEDPSVFIETRYNEVVLISARSNELKNKQRKGVIGDETYVLEKNKLTSLTLDLLTEIKSNDRLEDQEKASFFYGLDEMKFDFDVFLSFSSKDDVKVKEVSRLLRSKGLKVFASNDSLSHSAGLSYMDKIEYALKRSENFILYSTVNSMKSGWVKSEYETFYNEILSKNLNDRRLIILKGKSFSDDYVPFMLRRFQYADSASQVLNLLIPKAKNTTTPDLENTIKNNQNHHDKPRSSILNFFYKNYGAVLLLISLVTMALTFCTSTIVLLYIGRRISEGSQIPFINLNKEDNIKFGEMLFRINLGLIVLSAVVGGITILINP